jgi:hypothetical protein
LGMTFNTLNLTVFDKGLGDTARRSDTLLQPGKQNTSNTKYRECHHNSFYLEVTWWNLKISLTCIGQWQPCHPLSLEKLERHVLTGWSVVFHTCTEDRAKILSAYNPFTLHNNISKSCTSLLWYYSTLLGCIATWNEKPNPHDTTYRWYFGTKWR